MEMRRDGNYLSGLLLVGCVFLAEIFVLMLFGWLIGNVFLGVSKSWCLVVAVPVGAFGGFLIFTWRKRLSIRDVIAPALSLFILFLVLSLVLFAFLWFAAASGGTASMDDYQKALGLIGYPTDTTWNFPLEISDDMLVNSFSYHPAIGQGDGELKIHFQTTNTEWFDSYKSLLECRAVWSGLPSSPETKSYGIFADCADDYVNPPKDLTIFVVFSQPYRFGDWNHGVVSYSIVSQDQLDILCVYSRW